MIRVARADEAEALLALWREADAFPSFTDTLEGVTTVLAREGSAVLVAEDGGRIVGSLIAGWDGWRGTMYRLAVLPSHRRTGIATALVREAERRLLAAGARRFNAIVLHDERPAVAFWEQAGYRLQPEVGRFAKSIAQEGDAGSDAITRE